MKFRSQALTLGTAFIAVSIALSSCSSDDSVSVGTDDRVSAGTTDNNNSADRENSTPQPGSSSSVTRSVDVTQASLVSAMSKHSGGALVSRSSKDYLFPEVAISGNTISMSIPDGPVPGFPARRTVASKNGQDIGFGDAVILKFDMFSWSSGELVESSSQYTEALTVTSGVSDEIPVPDYLAQSLSGRKIGDIVQVVLPAGTESLPDYLDAGDAYVLLLELL